MSSLTITGLTDEQTLTVLNVYYWLKQMGNDEEIRIIRVAMHMTSPLLQKFGKHIDHCPECQAAYNARLEDYPELKRYSLIATGETLEEVSKNLPADSPPELRELIERTQLIAMAPEHPFSEIAHFETEERALQERLDSVQNLLRHLRALAERPVSVE